MTALPGKHLLLDPQHVRACVPAGSHRAALPARMPRIHGGPRIRLGSWSIHLLTHPPLWGEWQLCCDRRGLVCRSSCLLGLIPCFMDGAERHEDGKRDQHDAFKAQQQIRAGEKERIIQQPWLRMINQNKRLIQRIGRGFCGFLICELNTREKIRSLLN